MPSLGVIWLNKINLFWDALRKGVAIVWVGESWEFVWSISLTNENEAIYVTKPNLKLSKNVLAIDKCENHAQYPSKYGHPESSDFLRNIKNDPMSDSPHVVLRCNKYISLQHIKSYHTRALSRVKAATVTLMPLNTHWEFIDPLNKQLTPEWEKLRRRKRLSLSHDIFNYHILIHFYCTPWWMFRS